MLSDLDRKANALVEQGYAGNTKRTYTSAQKKYLTFCKIYGLVPCPATEEVLLWYVAYLYGNGVVISRSISVYLSAVRALHIDMGLSEPPHRSPRIKLALRGIERSGPPPVQKMPITFSILQRMHSLVGHSYDEAMLWGAMTLAYFGCLRADEITLDLSLPNMIKIPTVQDLSWLSHKNIPYFTLRIKQTKTQMHGMLVTVGCSGSQVCAYCALAKYLRYRHMWLVAPQVPALFVYSTGLVLDHGSFVRYTKTMVQKVGLDPSKYSGHSFRSGAASVAGTNNFQPWEIKLLGHWKSDVYQSYIRDTCTHAVGFAARLVTDS